MFILKKCIAAFLLPPGILVLILLAAGLWSWRLRRRVTAVGALLLALLAWSLSTAQVSQMLMGRLERGFAIPRQPQGDVIVLLGGGLHDKVPDLTGSGAPSAGMMTRIVTAVRLQRRLDLPILVSGGAVFGGRTAEAPVVRRFLMDLGVPERRIILEDKSRDTMENARFSREIIRRHGFRQPLLVTSAFHMRRSLEAFRRAGVMVTPLPAGFVTSAGHTAVWADFLPDSASLHGTATAMREYLGLLFYRLGGQGAT
ncbi:MAG: YdcF family protein [Deltaproteobacteria bacterium]|nr:YdcF family protein [Deltaproteobacteria bacterium]